MSQFIPPLAGEGCVETVAIVDTDEQALAAARGRLGLPESACFRDWETAFSKAPADFVLVCVPPQHNETIVTAAMRHGLDVLLEKPMAVSMQECIRLTRLSQQQDRRLALTMTHRFDQAHTTLRNAVHAAGDGGLDYLVYRLTANLRVRNTWGRYRHAMDDITLVDAAIHHFDLLRDMAGANARSVYAKSWTPAWGEFGTGANVLALVEFENGVKASYEAGVCNASSSNPPFKGYVRAERELATIVMSGGLVTRSPYQWTDKASEKQRSIAEDVPLVEGKWFGNTLLMAQFLAWMDGGPVMQTQASDALQSQAIIFAAVESAKTGNAVMVQEFLSAAEASC
jgi:predicted dehydrogenase